MHHKRGKPVSARAGCKMCKPNKLGKGMEKEIQHRGFGKMRKEASASADLKSADRELLEEEWDKITEGL